MSDSSSERNPVELLAEDYLERHRRGEKPSVEEYCGRHPDLADEIRDLFPALLMMEDIRPEKSSEATDAFDGGSGGPTKLPDRIGDYRILCEIGRGGMGVVYEAEQESLGRRVALKVLPHHISKDANALERFRREARSAARLHHTNIVPVFEVGNVGDTYFYAMQFIQGQGLDTVIDDLRRIRTSKAMTQTRAASPTAAGPPAEIAQSLMTGRFRQEDFAAEPSEVMRLSPEQEKKSAAISVTRRLSVADSAPSIRISGESSSPSWASSTKLGSTVSRRNHYHQSVARIGFQTADALSYAHSRGIIHRDIKPSNLLLDAAGIVWITDFGLAKTSDEAITHTGDILGTVRYMAPERFRGICDAAADVYALGLTLYELLTLTPAFQSPDRLELIEKVTKTEPASMRTIDPHIPLDLETIILKAIDKDPRARYASAEEFAQDLKRYLNDEPIKARRISPVERFTRWCRRNPAIASLLAALLVVFFAGFTGVTMQWRRADRLRVLADERRVEAEENWVEASRQQSIAERNLSEAQTQKQRAEENLKLAEAHFAKARAAVDFFTGFAESRLVTVPGAQAARRELLQSASAYYEEFVKQRGDDPSLRGEMAIALSRVGSINAELSNGTEAQNALRRAIELFEAQLRDKPADVVLKDRLANANLMLGMTYWYAGTRGDESTVACQRASALYEELRQSEPENAIYKRKLAKAYHSLGLTYSEARRLEDAMRVYEKALELRHELIRESPSDPELLHGLGETFNNVAGALSQYGYRHEALSMYVRSGEFTREAFLHRPFNVEYAADLGIGLVNTARQFAVAGIYDQAMREFEKAIEHYASYIRANPDILVVHRQMLMALVSLQNLTMNEERSNQANRLFRMVVEACDALPKQDIESALTAARAHALFAAKLGQSQTKLSTEAQVERRQQLDLAIARLNDALAAGFSDASQLRQDAMLQPLRARTEFQDLVTALEQGRRPGQSTKAQAKSAPAKRRMQQVIAEKQRRADDSTRRAQAVQSDLATSRLAVGLLKGEFGQHDESAKLLYDALALNEQLAKADPKNAQLQTNLAASHFILGHLEWKASRLASAVSKWQSALNMIDAARKLSPNDWQAKGQLATRLSEIARLYASVGLWNEAENALEQALEADAENIFLWMHRGSLLVETGDVQAYRQLCTAMLEKFKDTSDPMTAERVAKLCLTLPAEGDLLSRVGALADKAAASGNEHSYRSYFAFAKSLAEYRRGRFQEALNLISQEALTNQSRHYWGLTIAANAVSAMAQYRLDQKGAAEKSLAAAMSIIGRTRTRTAAHPVNNFHDWLIALALCREAHSMSRGRPMPNHAFVSLLRAKAYFQLEQKEAAEREWAAAEAANPKDGLVLVLRGKQFVELGLTDRAKTDFDKAVALDPDDPRTLLARGKFLAEHGDKAQSEKDLASAVAIVPKQAAKSASANDALEFAQLLLADKPNWTVLRPEDSKSAGGATLSLEADGSILASGTNPNDDSYTITFSPPSSPITGLRLETIPDRSFPYRGAGRQLSNGNFILSEFEVRIDARATGGASAVVAIESAFADFSKDGSEIGRAIDGSTATFWDTWPKHVEPRLAVFQFSKPIVVASGDRLTVRLNSATANFKQHAIGRFRLSATSDALPVVASRIRLEPEGKRPDGWTALTAVFVMTGKESELETIVAASRAARIGRARHYMQVKQWPNALEDWNRVLSVSSTDQELYASRAEVLMHTNQHATAIADWTRANQLKPAEYRYLEQRAHCFKAVQRFDMALADWTTLLQRDSNNAWLLRERGWCYDNMGQRERALADHNAAVQFGSPQDAWVFLSGRGVSYAGAGDWQRAADDFAKSLETLPDGRDWWIARDFAVVAMMLDDVPRTRHALEAFLARSTGKIGYDHANWLAQLFVAWPDALNSENRARVLEVIQMADDWNRPRLTAAFEYRMGEAQKANEIFTQHGGGHFGYLAAAAKHVAGQSKEASAELLQARSWIDELRRKDSQSTVPTPQWQMWVLNTILRRQVEPMIFGPAYVHVRSAEEAFQTGKPDEALAELKQAGEAGIRDAALLLQCGRLYLRMKNVDAAIEEYLRALELDPLTKSDWMASAGGPAGEIAANDALFDASVNRQPANRRLWIARAQFLGQHGKWQSASAAFAKVVELDPTDHEGWYHYSAVLLHLGDAEGFRRVCREMLDRFAETDNPMIAERTAKTCFLVELSTDQLPTPVKLAEFAAGKTDHDAFKWFKLAQGMGAFRAGDDAKANAALAEALSPGAEYVYRDGTAQLMISMCQKRLGNAEAAREAYQRAIAFARPNLIAPDDLGSNWQDLLRFQALLQEAKQRLGPLANGNVTGAGP